MWMPTFLVVACCVKMDHVYLIVFSSIGLGSIAWFLICCCREIYHWHLERWQFFDNTVVHLSRQSFAEVVVDSEAAVEGTV